MKKPAAVYTRKRESTDQKIILGIFFVKNFIQIIIYIIRAVITDNTKLRKIRRPARM
jgi:hypothetical protein